jgi:eukaryotic-like serine/threonine-protein kinase
LPTEPASEPALFRYRFDTVEFDETRFELVVGGLPVELEHKPLQVLGELLRHVGEVVTRQELLERVWAGRPTVDNVLPNAVAKLRKALGPAQADRIVTLPRLGYRLNGPVERTASGRRLASRLQLAGAQAVPHRPDWVLERQLNPSRASEVWLARHARTRELRVFKFGGDGERLAMLKREATLHRVLTESLGERDDIARILDWNFETPPFFLECEYGGDSLQAWAEAGHLAALDRDARLALFLMIAQAAAAAHSVGVLHKDIKPANVLIAPKAEGGWRIRLTDFGSGRLLNPERLAELGITRLGLTLTQALDADTSGTPLYLAPELIAGQPPTVRSEVYALGLLLYQLLAGDLKRPIAPGWEAAIDDALLAATIAAATDGDPARRLPTVSALIEQLATLEARRAAAAQARLREQRLQAAEAGLARSRARRPWIAAATAALAVGLAATLWQYRAADAAREDAIAQAALAREMNRFLNEDLLGGGRSRTATIAYDRNPSLRELLDAARGRLDGRFADAPLIEAGIRTTLGRAYRTLGDHAVAEAQLRRVTELHEARLLPADEKRLLGEYDLVTVLIRLSKFDEAKARLDEADALAGPRRDAIGELGLRAKLARGSYHFQRLEVQPALQAYLAAEAMQRVVQPADIPLAAHIRLTIGDASLRLGNAARAEAIAREVLAGDPYSEDSVGLSTLATARRLLGNALRNQGRPAEGIPHLERAVAEQERSRGADDQSTIAALSSLGYLYSLVGDVDRRARIQREVYARSVRRWGEANQYTLVERINLGDAEHEVGRLEVAEAHLRAAVDGLVVTSGEGSSLVDAARYSHANVLVALGRHAQALAVTERIEKTRLANASADAKGDGKLTALRGRALIGLGRADQGRTELTRAIDLLRAEGQNEAELAPLQAMLQSGAAP